MVNGDGKPPLKLSTEECGKFFILENSPNKTDF